MLRFDADDLTHPATVALVEAHVAAMYAISPPESVHALDLDQLRASDVEFHSGWRGEELVVIGALRPFADEKCHLQGELKSMRVAEPFLGSGAGEQMLIHLLGRASALGMQALWLETGAEPEFAPARGLYLKHGFEVCEPFAEYAPDPLSVFMTRPVESH